ncbi:MAG: peroxiredoxin family protein [Marinifilaceae bacterium]
MKYKLMLLLLLVGLMEVNAQGLNVGDKAPEIIQKSITGEVVKLSSFKGQMVLIDFWSSWCKPCRKENKYLVKAYQKFKNREFKNGEGFTILSVSLDSKEISWKRAIAKDSLTWPYHVSDFKSWRSSTAKKYKVRSIPQSYLIDGNGIIIAKNLRGVALERCLRKQVKRSLFFF